MKKALIAGLTIFLISQASFATSRVAGLVSSDIDSRLTEIGTLKNNIKSAQFNLSSLEVKLAEEQKKESRNRTAIRISKISGAVAVASMTALYLVRIGPKVLETPGVVKFTSMTALASTLTAITAGSLAFFTFDEATEVRQNIKTVISHLEDDRIQLNKEISLLCRDQPQHKECY